MNSANLLELVATKPQKNIGDPYLRLRLNQETIITLSMKHIQEVVIVPVKRITLMPNMPNCVLGLINQRSRVFWVIDLAQLLGLEPLATDVQQYSLVILRVGQIPLGLVVQEVTGIMRLTPEIIQSPLAAIAPEITPYLQGCVLEEKQVLLVLDSEAIVKAPIFNNNQ